MAPKRDLESQILVGINCLSYVRTWYNIALEYAKTFPYLGSLLGTCTLVSGFKECTMHL